jgi:hypothetical protein
LCASRPPAFRALRTRIRSCGPASTSPRTTATPDGEAGAPGHVRRGAGWIARPNHVGVRAGEPVLHGRTSELRREGAASCDSWVVEARAERSAPSAGARSALDGMSPRRATRDGRLDASGARGCGAALRAAALGRRGGSRCAAACPDQRAERPSHSHFWDGLRAAGRPRAAPLGSFAALGVHLAVAPHTRCPGDELFGKAAVPDRAAVGAGHRGGQHFLGGDESPLAPPAHQAIPPSFHASDRSLLLNGRAYRGGTDQDERLGHARTDATGEQGRVSC